LNENSLVVRALLTEASRAAGVRTVTWNGKNNAGAFVSPGTYTVKITATDSTGKVGSTTMDVEVVE
jgi:flagellar hook assembly protein FlgD